MARHGMRPRDILALHWAQDPQLSPDRRSVVWCEVSLNEAADEPVSRIMVATSDGGEEPRPFSDGPGDSFPRFSGDGRQLAYLSAADGPPCLRLAPLIGGAPRKVETPGAVSWLSWSPAGDQLALVVKVGGSGQPESPQARNAPVLVRGLSNRLDGQGYRSGRDQVYVYDVPSASLRQITKGDFDHAFPSWAPDGRRLVFVSDRGARRDDRLGCGDLWAVDAGGGRPERLTRGVGGAAYPTFSPDGRLVAFTGVPVAEEMFGRDTRVLVVDSSGGEPKPVAPLLDRPTGVAFGAAKPFAWLSDDELIFNVVDRGTIGISRAKVTARTARPVVARDIQVLGLAVAGSGRGARLTYEGAWVDRPSEIFVSSQAIDAPVRVSRASEHMTTTVELVPASRHRTTAPDGLEIEYFLMRPPPTGKARRSSRDRTAPPLFLEIHGGPASYNPHSFLSCVYQSLAAGGYAVVLPNPRGSVGYGESFRRASMHSWGADDFTDVNACADDAVSRGYADGRRQYVGGYSYGGFMTAWAIGHTDRFRGAIVGAPVIDYVSMFGTTDVPTFLAAGIGGDPWSGPDALRTGSPLAHLGEVTTPVLLHVNEGDLRCPPGQADQLHSGLRWLGKEVEYVRYPGGSHLSFFPMMGAPSQSIDRMTRFLDFLARHGGPKPGVAP